MYLIIQSMITLTKLSSLHSVSNWIYPALRIPPTHSSQATSDPPRESLPTSLQNKSTPSNSPSPLFPGPSSPLSGEVLPRTPATVPHGLSCHRGTLEPHSMVSMVTPHTVARQVAPQALACERDWRAMGGRNLTLSSFSSVCTVFIPLCGECCQFRGLFLKQEEDSQFHVS